MRRSRRQLESQIHTPLIGFTQPFRPATQAPEVIFATFFAPFLRGIGETLMSQVRMRRNASKARVNALASQTHDAH